ncbi:LacI family DNA-binding transcriptional regulator [Planctomonas sp. JC2975]|uniref:LacI family DNA-binding transcriptional regulator n=1 Tax=Planctomonas sp. JC2975 TaxID=2729626 RepID=UPI0014729F37|nr:LacI family DNA-binding transcriptional regulator [Planctomonas sp. JC2975]NNC12769.1 LacI family DNA-binding transcriptional regulator [Planctomonas sp. JC2975]
MAVTAHDVAKVAGVSQRTVSNVVNIPDRVGAETRKRVQAVIDELGYRPNPHARGLRTSRTGVIAFVVPELDIPYFSDLARSLIPELDQRSLTLVVDQTNGDPDRERAMLQGGSVSGTFDGVLLNALNLTAADIEAAAATQPIVLLGEEDYGPGVDQIAVDGVEAAYVATRHLIDTGRTRIAALGRQSREAGTTAQREAGFVAAMTEAGLDPFRYMSRVEYTRESGAAAMRAMLDGDAPPDGVFCFNDLLALGAMRAAWERGLEIPRQIAFVGFDDIEDGRYSMPSLTTIAPDKATIARRAVEMLTERIAGRTGPGRREKAGFELVVRESSAARH